MKNQLCITMRNVHVLKLVKIIASQERQFGVFQAIQAKVNQLISNNADIRFFLPV